ncbi:hypothetical protein M409DRAFT_54702 [Zasmidium cellare ATCC 36951]|uniref:F-box domain-containing protein n=1 Tax=Zasmidium cellare ATCC 36951 TaxID=1080233 RepID=A0A6A6CLB4_ZASCE|nr:uncharacterized protein M409DRAFT_54702 [Zasmidium cellare ATCC 36951]KAF2166940.1 hypothetical protein M409DRAFT_54702 [Zasmidium cellare ATCC 36951]
MTLATRFAADIGNRKIPYREYIPRRMTRSDLARVLERADEYRTFTKFLELPTELRVHIYLLHFADLPPVPISTESPPITQVSSLLRKEALPLWYEPKKLIVKFVQYSNGRFRCSGASVLLHAPKSVLPHVRVFQVCGSVQSLELCWEVRLAKEEKKEKQLFRKEKEKETPPYEVIQRHGQTGYAKLLRVANTMELRLRGIIDERLRVGGCFQPQNLDQETFRMVFVRALAQYNE